MFALRQLRKVAFTAQPQIWKPTLYYNMPMYSFTSTSGTKSLYDQLGGEAAVDAVVDAFYVKVLADPKVSGFFKNTDMKKQRKHQKNFMTLAFGGPMKYSGRNMRDAHKDFKLDDSHFNAIGGHLASTLRDFKVSEDLIKQVLAIVETTRADVLNK